MKTGKMKLLKVMTLLTLLTSCVALILWGVLTFVWFDVYVNHLRVGCGSLFENPETCALYGRWGAAAVNFCGLSIGLIMFAVNILEIIAASKMRTLKIAGLKIYYISTFLVVIALLFAAIVLTTNLPILALNLAGSVGMCLVYRYCLKSDTKDANFQH